MLNETFHSTHPLHMVANVVSTIVAARGREWGRSESFVFHSMEDGRNLIDILFLMHFPHQNCVGRAKNLLIDLLCS